MRAMGHKFECCVTHYMARSAYDKIRPRCSTCVASMTSCASAATYPRLRKLVTEALSAAIWPRGKPAGIMFLVVPSYFAL